MAGNKYLYNNAGQPTEKAALQVSAGAGSAGSVVALNSAGQIDSTMLATSSGLISVTVTASAAISAGQLVNVYNNAGAINVRPADNTTAGSEANGYAPSAISSGASGTVNLGEGLITGLSGLTVGSAYYLGTAGGQTTTAPTTAGNLVQYVGKAISGTSLYFQPSTFTVVVA